MFLFLFTFVWVGPFKRVSAEDSLLESLSYKADCWRAFRLLPLDLLDLVESRDGTFTVSSILPKVPFCDILSIYILTMVWCLQKRYSSKRLAHRESGVFLSHKQSLHSVRTRVYKRTIISRQTALLAKNKQKLAYCTELITRSQHFYIIINWMLALNETGPISEPMRKERTVYKPVT